MVGRTISRHDGLSPCLECEDSFILQVRVLFDNLTQHMLELRKQFKFQQMRYSELTEGESSVVKLLKNDKVVNDSDDGCNFPLLKLH